MHAGLQTRLTLSISFHPRSSEDVPILVADPWRELVILNRFEVEVESKCCGEVGCRLFLRGCVGDALAISKCGRAYDGGSRESASRSSEEWWKSKGKISRRSITITDDVDMLLSLQNKQTAWMRNRGQSDGQGRFVGWTGTVRRATIAIAAASVEDV